MQSLPLPVVASPLASFKQHRFNSDPSRFSLNLSLSPAQKTPSLWATSYPSPPMSGSPPPEQRHEVPRGTRRRRRSESPTSVPVVSTTAPPSLGDRPDPVQWQGALGRSPDTERRSVRRDPYYGEYVPVEPSVSATAGEALRAGPSAAPPQDPQLSSQPGFPSPKSTRRSKAHVASACVNCKRKHLRCDAARPCQRCVQSGKEDTCKDTEHKKRGRPPLKAEEGHMGKPFEATFAQVEIPPTNASSWTTHRRTSSSRQIRPMPDIRPSGIGEMGRERAVYQRPGPIIPPQYTPSGWGPSYLSPTQRGGPISPTVYSGFRPGSRPFSSGSSQAPSQPPSPYHSSQGMISPIEIPRSAPQYPSYLSHAPPPSIISQSPLQQSFPAPFAPLVSQIPRPPTYPGISEPASSQAVQSRDERQMFQLPPIRQLPGDSSFQPPPPPRREAQSVPWPVGSQTEQPPRIYHPEPIARPVHPGGEYSYPRISASMQRPEMYPPLHSTTSAASASSVPATTAPFATHLPPPPPRTEPAVYEEQQQSEEPKPKRLKMTLGEMVNK